MSRRLSRDNFVGQARDRSLPLEFRCRATVSHGPVWRGKCGASPQSRKRVSEGVSFVLGVVLKSPSNCYYYYYYYHYYHYYYYYYNCYYYYYYYHYYYHYYYYYYYY